jgi:hypothetical protein
MPSEDRVRRHDCGDLREHPVASCFSFRRQATSLSVGEAQAFAPELLLQDPILFAEVLDRGMLVASDPPGSGNDEDLPWTNHPCHAAMMQVVNFLRKIPVAGPQA